MRVLFGSCHQKLDSMSPKCSLIIVCVWGCWILGGLPAGVNSDVSTDEAHPKTVTECRVHIEKALEEYWDKTGPNPDATNSNKNLLANSEQTNADTNCDGDRNCNKEANAENDHPAIETDNDNDEDDDDNDNDDGLEDADQSSSELDTSESSQNTESQVESPKEVENSQLSNKSAENSSLVGEVHQETVGEVHQETVGEVHQETVGEVHQETRRIYVVKNLNKEPIEFDDLNSDKKEPVTEEKDDAEDESDDKEETDESGVESVKNDTVVEGKGDGIVNQLNDDNDDDDDEDGDDEEDEEEALPEVSETVSSKTIATPASDLSSETQINTSKVVEEKELPIPQIVPSVVSQSVVESSNLATESLEVSQKPPQDTPIVSSKDETGTKEELIENIYEEEDDDDDEDGLAYRNPDHIDVILGLDEIVPEVEEEKLAQSIFKDIKKIELTNIKPMELLYKFADSTSRSLGDAEILSKPMLLFLGPWNAGKTSIINYILGIERTPSALETGTGITDTSFTVLTHGPQRRVISGTELATDWRYSGVQRFGQGFLDHFRSINIPHALLQKVIIVDTPGILENKKPGHYSINDAFQWFIDRADAIYVVLDPNKVDIGSELARVIDQLKGREVRFVLNKADSIRRSDLMRVVGQLFWNLSPLMSSSEAPVIYAVSLTTRPYQPTAPMKFLDDQEKNLLYDMRSTLDRRVENRILYARKHAVRVRNHAKMVDCYLATFYRHKSIFSNKRNVAKQIVDNPGDYSIYDGLGGMTNVSRYDLPDPTTYKDFFRTHPLYDFKPLASTCSYFRGCPMDKLDEAIAKDIPELLARYKKAKTTVQEILPGGKP